MRTKFVLVFALIVCVLNGLGEAQRPGQISLQSLKVNDDYIFVFKKRKKYKYVLKYVIIYFSTLLTTTSTRSWPL